jgi:FixJ family two-component response regulator
MARQTAIEAGAFAFLSKPFDDEVLMQLIREALAG